mmetsp:Transcript_8665/g.22360  ORF Transcript_8665/g.22360 Transcript_8665/m.22360 type:complete len:329 (+) Transcript_8665:1130-2116(+)
MSSSGCCTTRARSGRTSSSSRRESASNNQHAAPRPRPRPRAMAMASFPPCCVAYLIGAAKLSNKQTNALLRYITPAVKRMALCYTGSRCWDCHLSSDQQQMRTSVKKLERERERERRKEAARSFGCLSPFLPSSPPEVTGALLEDVLLPVQLDDSGLEHEPVPVLGLELLLDERECEIVGVDLVLQKLVDVVVDVLFVLHRLDFGGNHTLRLFLGIRALWGFLGLHALGGALRRVARLLALLLLGLHAHVAHEGTLLGFGVDLSPNSQCTALDELKLPQATQVVQHVPVFLAVLLLQRGLGFLDDIRDDLLVGFPDLRGRRHASHAGR